VFRLIKLVAYVLVGYMLYELFQGLNAERKPAGQSRRQVHPGDIDASTQPGIGTMTGSGGGQGQRVETQDASGESVPHVVGRGVV